MPSWITTKLLSYVSGGLFLALLGTSAALWATSVKLDAAEVTIESRDTEIATLESAVANRDASIATQNKAIADLKAQADRDRTEYLQRIRQAEQKATGYRQQAISLLDSNLETTDELERCREAVELIHITLSQEP